MKKVLYLTSFGLLVLFGGGCSQPSDNGSLRQVAIAPVITRVEGLNFEVADRIGLSIVRASGSYVENKPMTYDGTLFTSPDLTWYAERDEQATLVAYYPYDPEGVPAGFMVAADQSAGTEESDLLGAVKSGVVPTSSAVGMVFRHLLSSVRVVVTNTTRTAVTELKIGGTVLEAEVELQSQTVRARSGASPQEIRAFVAEGSDIYEAVVVPQSAALRITVATDDGRSRSAEFDVNTFLPGKYYTVSLVVEEEALRTTLSGEVADWETGGALESGGENTGETDGTEQPDVPSDGTMLCMGESYTTVEIGGRIWMAENLRYVPEDSMDGCWYPNGEISNREKYGMLYNFDAAQRFCPEGWRLPDKEDFEALIAALEPPYDFIPLAGIYARSQNQPLHFDARGYLMGSTPGQASSLGLYLLHTGVGTESLAILESALANGVSVRFVRDAE